MTRLGATVEAQGTRFRVWAPDKKSVAVVWYRGQANEQTAVPLERATHGYFEAFVPGVRAGDRYGFSLDGGPLLPDPASRYQPEGVHAPSAVVDPAYTWKVKDFRGVPLADAVIYELHVGTFTREGTFRAAVAELERVAALGITLIELMPVADFPGRHNWGYDGVSLFAPARAYGTPDELRALVDAAHARGIGVIQDVVYNHLGPSGNYLSQYCERYFDPAQQTPWGAALNFSERGVREFFIENAQRWVEEFHVDGLRLDATHAILDASEEHFLAELARRVKASAAPRRVLLIAEDDRNEVKLVEPRERGGYGLDAVWADDFHHAVHVATSGEQQGYFAAFSGSTHELAETLRGRWLFSGQPSELSGAPRGTPAAHAPAQRFVYAIQNHDQVGNRPLGDRPATRLSAAAYRAVSALLLLAPATPMLFQGQEWASRTPFMYFTDHEPELGRLVTEGRRAEFRYFQALAKESVPDPQARDTFLKSQLSPEERSTPEAQRTLALYRALIALRRELFSQELDRDQMRAEALDENALLLRYPAPGRGARELVVLWTRGPARLPMRAISSGHTSRSWAPVLWTEAIEFGGALPRDKLIAQLAGGELTLEHPLTLVLREHA
jgi:maltooligosyltrehalose trehalohydrolase